MAGRIPVGSVTQRSGHWVVRVPAGMRPDGSRDIYQETLPTRRLATTRRDELVALTRQNPGRNLRELLDQATQEGPEPEGVPRLIRAPTSTIGQTAFSIEFALVHDHNDFRGPLLRIALALLRSSIEEK